MLFAASQFAEAPGLVFLGKGNVQARGIRSDNEGGDGSIALEFGRNHNITLEIIMRMVAMGLRPGADCASFNPMLGSEGHAVKCVKWILLPKCILLG